jgi:AbrB family looped-hinge helix DNA binding protein
MAAHNSKMATEIDDTQVRSLKLDGKGRVTIPKDIRDRYDAESGDRVSVAVVSVETDGYVCDECGRRYELPEVLVFGGGDRVVCGSCTTTEDRIIE